jgi:hypothetical protein
MPSGNESPVTVGQTATFVTTTTHRLTSDLQLVGKVSNGTRRKSSAPSFGPAQLQQVARHFLSD